MSPTRHVRVPTATAEETSAWEHVRELLPLGWQGSVNFGVHLSGDDSRSNIAEIRLVMPRGDLAHALGALLRAFHEGTT